MKILVVTTSFPSRANETLSIAGKFILYECLAYEESGAEVEVIAPDISICPKEEVFGKNIRVHRIQYFSPAKLQILRRADGSALYDSKNIFALAQFPFLFLAFLLAILRYGRKVDIVHCNWSFTAFAALPLRWIYKIPVVLTTRGSDLRLVPKFLNQFIFKNIDAVLDCFGPDYRKLFASIEANYIQLPVITPNPKIDPELVKKVVRPGEFLVVLIGRFDSTKLDLYGMPFFTLLDSISTLSRKNPLRCIYVGDGPLKSDIEKKCSELGCQHLVSFAGFQDNIYPFMQAADIVIGGLGLNAVSQEAAILNKVQLMPRIKHWYENIWFDKKNALLYDMNDPWSLTEALGFAIENPQKMKTISANIKETTNCYINTIENGGNEYLEVFRSIIKNKI